MQRDAWIIDGVRSPRARGRADGALHDVHPQELLGQTLRALAIRAGIDPTSIDDVVIGNGSNAGEHANDIARMAVLSAGWPASVPGVTLNRFCGSGQQAVTFAAMAVLSGMQEVVVAGGVESMSRYDRASVVPMHAGNEALLTRNPLVPQGISADLVATMEGLSRSELDAFAIESQARTANAVAAGAFDRSVVPITRSDGVRVDADEHPRPGTTLEDLAAIPPAFARAGAKPRDPSGLSYDQMALSVYPEVRDIPHVHHAGNSSGVVDGAAATLVASSDRARAEGWTPRARIVATAVAGSEPVIMLTAPGPAAQAALEKAGMTVDDIDLWEINEAFAAIPIKVVRDLTLDEERVNVNGGAIALGHPIGATGAILLQTVLDELERRDQTTGLVTMCTGGGMGTATIIERI